MRVASFFSGIGGFDLGFERAGMEVVFQCEINPFGQQVLRKHWPHVPLHNDIQTLLPDEIPEADIYCGGFPCQDVSLANQGKRKGLDGERSGLFYKFAEFVDWHRPKWVVLENVPGLLNSQHGNDFRVVVQTLDEFGYGVAWRIFDAKYFGTPQRRRRVFIVASYRTLSAATVLLDEQTLELSFGSGNSEKQTSASRNGTRHSETNLYTIQHAAVGRKHTAGPQSKGYRNDGETWTLDSRGSGDVLCSTDDAFGIRETTGISRELDSARYRALGNAVCVPVIEWIGKRIIAVNQENLEPDKDLYPQNHIQKVASHTTQLPLFID
ncbi:MAG: DNA (cytosine-5-)-methyltransferase [Anaerolineae bacterium]|nr:DNA (cytosine-5-)-methyltransferase [Anaerolineae bacterium]